MSERIEIKLMGKVLGTADGWDGEMPTFAFYDFQPAEGISLKAGDLQIDYETGMFDIVAESGDVLDTGSIVPLFS